MWRKNLCGDSYPIPPGRNHQFAVQCFVAQGKSLFWILFGILRFNFDFDIHFFLIFGTVLLSLKGATFQVDPLLVASLTSMPSRVSANILAKLPCGSITWKMWQSDGIVDTIYSNAIPDQSFQFIQKWTKKLFCWFRFPVS